ncbi:sulfite exporter TauE/SafE family protein [Pseudonocardia sp. KRD-184]|uniref:Probable membrane transporter protein n=1 Tax=Pseudonocardia oceani TaxID=2792013 RepID=A0ABS6UIR1_9PSEU|nr:sulfite exporter TauE/SafE family protein [Pseudonocardia oceani]MBW0098998.1 sulfite exporter TauE/SafE family protein [Pseudonocardia oceani]MBW0109654.1 sulfite exporter TauE/SafE family protein [Pseudonocardia oceani]MBW0123534.1 sulfite exporter TauE/SafE family protein [Pseudonocardia oceani]MBW0132135.1 sulfite exporter TauE/SafE family protein [Pseudonocardia oceani]
MSLFHCRFEGVNVSLTSEGVGGGYGRRVLIVVAGLVVAVGALVQGTVGFGLALVAAPLLAILDPALVPVPLLMITAVHALLTLRREYGDTDWRGVGWALLGRLPGIGLGVLAVSTFPPRLFVAAVGLTVLVCAALSVVRWRLRPTVPALLVAGLVSGAGGTASSIGGPPVALLYQGDTGPRVRSTLAAYFTAGTLLSIAALAVGGQVDGADLLAGGLLVVPMLAGFALSGPARPLLDRGWTRPAVVTLAAAGALALLVQAALG